MFLQMILYPPHSPEWSEKRQALSPAQGTATKVIRGVKMASTRRTAPRMERRVAFAVVDLDRPKTPRTVVAVRHLPVVGVVGRYVSAPRFG
jgi:hypothetical protein